MKRMFIVILVITSASIAFSATMREEPRTIDEVSQTIAALEDEYADATSQNDTNRLNRIFSDGYIFMNAAGDTRTKDQLIADIKAGELTYKSYRADNVRVHASGNIAKVTGHATVTFTWRRKEYNEQYNYLRVYVKQEGDWQQVASSRGCSSL
jgi:ketosteroid isomerase-like protein